MCLALALGALIGPMAVIAAVKPGDAGPHRGWKAVGPAPGAIPAAIAAHARSGTIYIGSLQGGLLKSTDGGAHFVSVYDGGVPSMVMDPNDPNVVYAGGAKTIDGGVTWNFQAGGGGLFMAMDPANPSVLYSTFVGVEKSIDGGETWEGASEGLGSALIFSLAISPFDSDLLFAGTNGDGAFRSTDGGASWTPLDIDATVWGILVDPDDGNVVYAGSNGNGVYKSTDAGVSFAPVGSPAVGVVFSLAKSGHRLYAGTASGGVSVSEDGGATWRNTGVTQSQGLTLSVDSAGAVYLGTNVDGAFKLAGTPHGRRGFGFDRDNRKWRRIGWDQLKSCACQDGHAVVIDPSNHERVFLTTNDGGLIVTEDGGRSWKDGGTRGFLSRSPRGVAFDPQQPRRVYASSFVGGGLFKSEDQGKTWERRLFGSSTTYTTGIAVDPVDHSVYVATVGGGFALLPNGVWKSTDFGETFTRIDRAPGAAPDEFLDLNGRGITVDPHNHTTVYLPDRSSGLWRSQDAGASWVNVHETPAFSVTVDPVDPQIAYAGTVFQGVLKSVDGGSTWAQKSNGLPSFDPSDPDAYFAISRTAGVQVHSRNHDVLYAGTEGEGVFKSTDGAETWRPVNLGLDNPGVIGLALDPVDPNILYAATSSSVFKTRSGGE
ncbi:MAG: hypothetical protein ABW056_07880 [Thermoanaerobaculia bacterium]